MSEPVKKKAGKSGKTTVRDIKAWLQGILEFQPAGWVPSETQWATIKDKIMSLQDEEIVYQKTPASSEKVTQNVQTQPAQPAQPRVIHDAAPSGPSALNVPYQDPDGYKTKFG